jgi:ABC-type antimicrobial peptide transport system permease subunit
METRLIMPLTEFIISFSFAFLCGLVTGIWISLKVRDFSKIKK